MIDTHLQTPRKTAASILSFSILLACMSFFVPAVASAQNPLQTHWRTAIAMFIGVLFTTGVIWFSGSIKSFRASLRTAYKLALIGIIILSVSFFQLPILGLLDLWGSLWATAGGVVLPFIFATLLMYMGMRRFAMTLQINNPIMRPLVAFPVAITSTALVWFAAQYWVQYKLDGIDVYITAVSWTAIFAIFSAILVLKIKNTISQYYKPAMSSLGHVFIGLSTAAIIEVLTTTFTSTEIPYDTYGAYLWPFAVCGLLLLRAGYTFQTLQQSYANSVGESVPLDERLIASDQEYFEGITVIASFAAQPEEIDNILDELRIISAHIRPDTSLSSADKQRLMAVYYSIETYLTRRDPIRTFKREDLRQQTSPAFQVAIEKAYPVNMLQ